MIDVRVAFIVLDVNINSTRYTFLQGIDQNFSALGIHEEAYL